MNIFVGNLPYNTTEDELRELFEQFGDVESVRIISDRETGRSRGFGFVKMAEKGAASSAIEKLDGHSMNGRPISVREAEERARQR